MDHMAFKNIISSKRLNIPLALRFQKVLDVDLISETQLRTSFESFIGYLKEEYSLWLAYKNYFAPVDEDVNKEEFERRWAEAKELLK